MENNFQDNLRGNNPNLNDVESGNNQSNEVIDINKNVDLNMYSQNNQRKIIIKYIEPYQNNAYQPPQNQQFGNNQNQYGSYKGEYQQQPQNNYQQQNYNNQYQNIQPAQPAQPYNNQPHVNNPPIQVVYGPDPSDEERRRRNLRIIYYVVGIWLGLSILSSIIWIIAYS